MSAIARQASMAEQLGLTLVRDAPTGANARRAPRSPLQTMALQRAVGNRTTVTLLRATDVGVDAGEVPSAWAALETQLRQLTAELLRANERPAILGTRRDLLYEVQMIWSGLGPPDASVDKVARVTSQLEDFKRRLAEEHEQAQSSWEVVEEVYRIERESLLRSAELSDNKAVAYLDAAHDYSWKRMVAAGNRARLEDVYGLYHELATGRHIKLAFEETTKATESVSFPWPAYEAKHQLPPTIGEWLPFKAAKFSVEGAHHGLEVGGHEAVRQAKRSHLVRYVDSAMRHELRYAVHVRKSLLGQTPAEAAEWARRAYRASIVQRDRLVSEISGSRWAGDRVTATLKVAGQLAVVIDIVGTEIHVRSLPPQERPKQRVIQYSRIVGGLAGAAKLGAVGATKFSTWGAKRFGPKGGFVGGLIGGIGGALIGGITGAMGGKKAGEYVAELVWPPDATSYAIAR